jgi:hypothetical protein
MHEVLNLAMGHLEDLVDRAAKLQASGDWIEASILLQEAEMLAKSIDNEEDILTMKLLSEMI